MTAKRCKQLEYTAAGLLAAALIAPASQAAGLMTPAGGSLPELQLRDHHVAVVIEDGYAITTVDQVFFNPHDQALEAVYSFPVPEEAAVGEFTYWIDGKPVVGEVLEKARAREVYEQEKAQGRETALTEQDEYRSFDSRVYPVRANDEVHIQLVYIQPTHVDLGIGRYVYPLEEGGVDEQKMAFWTYNDTVEENFSFDLRMRSSYPVDTFRLPQHPQALVTRTDANHWQVAMDNGGTPGIAAAGANGALADDDITAGASAVPQTAGTASHTPYRLDQDIVVYWRHQQGLPGSVDMVTHRAPDSKRGSFMLTVTPGDDLGPVTGGRDWVFVLDYSGSMQGKYQSLIEGVSQGLHKLNPQDRFRIVLFNNGTRALTRNYVPVTAANIERYIRELESISPSGGTNLYAGLETGYRGLDADRPSAIILVTDGVANVGTTEKKAFLELLQKHDVRLFSFVMGNSANRPLLEGMAEVSHGFAMNISNADDIAGRLLQTAEKLTHEAYRDISIDIDGVKVADLTPAHIGSLYRGQQLVVFGHYWGEGEASAKISGKVSGREVEYRTPLSFPAQDTLNPELERLWAFASIEALDRRIDYLGEDSDSRQAIVDLALEYGLVTDYTSMVVVRDEVFAEHGIDRDNAARVATEQAARAAREAAPVRDHRQDGGAPAFNAPRATPGGGGSGGGAVGPWGLLLLLPLLFKRRTRRAQ
ncbi:VWA domain-containing protein [Mangrovimicrobium sediminis]|uniref:VWA domain-containing protein n=1 Tax=Mangrovimicrobium sediminis TaxID=2562682 RepID=A0A4Z0M2A0_9GAMM|nr:VIT and VWA domain-containing protein [Haliea sp. SAOS-164]TGD73498.1 VWA domain-containing protein [Haliea sp. SAOS-164]